LPGILVVAIHLRGIVWQAWAAQMPVQLLMHSCTPGQHIREDELPADQDLRLQIRQVSGLGNRRSDELLRGG
jgi:hypothetical protein